MINLLIYNENYKGEFVSVLGASNSVEKKSG